MMESISKSIIVGISLIVGLITHSQAWASSVNKSPAYTVSPSSLTIAPNLALDNADDSSIDGNTLTLTNDTFRPIRNLSFNTKTDGFEGRIKVEKGDNCLPLKAGKDCTLTITAVDVPDDQDDQPTTLYIHNTSGAKTKPVDIDVKRPTVEDEGHYLFNTNAS